MVHNTGIKADKMRVEIEAADRERPHYEENMTSSLEILITGAEAS